MRDVEILLPHVLDVCNVTWTLDEQELRYFKRMTQDAIAYFVRRTGEDLDLTDGQVRTLLVHRVLYDHNKRLEWFEHNYQNEIMQLLVSYAAEDLAMESELHGDH